MAGIGEGIEVFVGREVARDVVRDLVVETLRGGVDVKFDSLWVDNVELQAVRVNSRAVRYIFFIILRLIILGFQKANKLWQSSRNPT